MRTVHRQWNLTCFLVVVSLSFLAVGEPPVKASKETKSDKALLKGKWVCVATIKDGKEVKMYVGVRAVIEGDNLTWFYPLKDGTFREQKTKFRIDPTKDPKHFDWWEEEKPKFIEKRIYSVTDKELRWATNLDRKTRPESFEGARWQFTMKRAK